MTYLVFLFYLHSLLSPRLPWWLSGKQSACQCGRCRSDPGLGRSPGGGNGKPLQYSCLGNFMNRGAWLATINRITRVGYERLTKPPPPTRVLKVKVLVTQSCPALCNPMDCSPPGSSVHEILQARILKWAAILFSGDLSHPGIKPTSRTLQVDSLLSEPPVTNKS